MLFRSKPMTFDICVSVLIRRERERKIYKEDSLSTLTQSIGEAAWNGTIALHWDIIGVIKLWRNRL